MKWEEYCKLVSEPEVPSCEVMYERLKKEYAENNLPAVPTWKTLPYDKMTEGERFCADHLKDQRKEIVEKFIRKRRSKHLEKIRVSGFQVVRIPRGIYDRMNSIVKSTGGSLTKFVAETILSRVESIEKAMGRKQNFDILSPHPKGEQTTKTPIVTNSDVNKKRTESVIGPTITCIKV